MSKPHLSFISSPTFYYRLHPPPGQLNLIQQNYYCITSPNDVLLNYQFVFLFFLNGTVCVPQQKINQSISKCSCLHKFVRQLSNLRLLKLPTVAISSPVARKTTLVNNDDWLPLIIIKQPTMGIVWNIPGSQQNSN
jgi:hypothetical protein